MIICNFSVDKLHADVLSDTSIEITWSDPADTDVTQVEVSVLLRSDIINLFLMA